MDLTRKGALMSSTGPSSISYCNSSSPSFWKPDGLDEGRDASPQGLSDRHSSSDRAFAYREPPFLAQGASIEGVDECAETLSVRSPQDFAEAHTGVYVVESPDEPKASVYAGRMSLMRLRTTSLCAFVDIDEALA